MTPPNVINLWPIWHKIMFCCRASRLLTLSVWGIKAYLRKLFSDSSFNTFRVQDATDVIRSVREATPAHYLLEIESFTNIKDSIAGLNLEHFESTEFDAAGHKWILVIYPHGNKDEDGKDHISLYLKLISELDRGWPVNATIKFFIYDHRREKYLTLQGLGEHTYDAKATEKGIARAIPFSNFTLPSNGFLKNDRCKFGVEVFVANTTPRTATLSVLKERKRDTFTWTIEEFSKLPDLQDSKEFTREGRRWKLKIYPTGRGAALRKSLSLFLNLVDFSDLTDGRKLFVEKTLRVKNQLNGEDASDSTCSWYTKASHCKGTAHLLSVSDLHNANKGFKIVDQVIVEVKLTLIMLMNDK